MDEVKKKAVESFHAEVDTDVGFLKFYYKGEEIKEKEVR